MSIARLLVSLLVPVLLLMQSGGCSTAPKTESDRTTLVSDAKAQTRFFEKNVTGLDNQIAGSAGYIVFPDVAQWGVLITGGTYGRGVLFDGDGKQIGWSKVQVTSAGLQAGLQGLSMLIVLQNEEALAQFKANKWTGRAQGVAVAGDAAMASAASFTEGVAIYQTAHEGLMAGMSIGLEHVAYEPMSAYP